MGEDQKTPPPHYFGPPPLLQTFLAGTLNTLPNKNLETNGMDVHCILIEIFNGEQARRASSMLTKIEVKQTIRTTHALAQILSSRLYTLRHCNARGCEYGRREMLVECCSNAGPPSSVPASPWRLVAAYPVYVYSLDIAVLYWQELDQSRS